MSVFTSNGTPKSPDESPLDLWRADLRRIAAERNWGIAIMAIGWLHLGFFLICQGVYSSFSDPRPVWPFPVLWVTEVVATLLLTTFICGKRWSGGSPSGMVLVRIWATYLILCFGVSTLNRASGLDHSWYKLVWGTLGTFGFATMAWLINGWFLVAAVQMYFMSLLMVRFPESNFLIHGISWCLALNVIGWIVWRRCSAPAPAKAQEPRAITSVVVKLPPKVTLPRGPLRVVLTRTIRED